MEKESKLILIEKDVYTHKSHKYSLYKCFCGRQVEMRNSSVNTGNSKSCGCTSKRGYKEILKYSNKTCPILKIKVPKTIEKKYRHTGTRLTEEEKKKLLSLDTKVCATCNIELPKDVFTNHSPNVDGKRSSCKVCMGITKTYYCALPGNPNSVGAILNRKYRKNPHVRLAHRLRNRIYGVLKGKTKFGKSLELTGCTAQELKEYIQSKFIEGMSFDNYGEWHIDHITPCNSFNLTIEEEQRKCFHYTNLQPLWAKDNLIKHAKINVEQYKE